MSISLASACASDFCRSSSLNEVFECSELPVDLLRCLINVVCFLLVVRQSRFRSFKINQACVRNFLFIRLLAQTFI